MTCSSRTDSQRQEVSYRYAISALSWHVFSDAGMAPDPREMTLSYSGQLQLVSQKYTSSLGIASY